jgi:hypothetical protein
MNDTRITMTHQVSDTEALQARYALRVAARLSAQCDLTTHDVAERLRFAREDALTRARAARAGVSSPALQTTSSAVGVLVLGGEPRGSSRWWHKLAAVLPLLVLVAGLVLIQNQHVRAEIAAAAEIDFDLLVDELPPAAYSDPGFLEFLKAPKN